MKNRAKCLKCESVIESCHSTDVVFCECDEIGVHGGNSMRCVAKDWKNFARVDEDGNVIMPQIKEYEDGQEPADIDTIKDSVNHLINIIESMPENARASYLNHYDQLSILLLIKAVLSKMKSLYFLL